jgi:hypothetical protein
MERKRFMNKQDMTDNRNRGQLCNFNDYKKNKPFFKNPIKITVGKNHKNDTYYMFKNIVYQGKQILALKQEQDPYTILLAEGKIKDGKLQCLSKLPKESLNDIRTLIEESI